MKKVVKLASLCLVCIALLGMASCGSKVDQKELNKKIENALQSDKEPEFTEAEYQFMADYLNDNYNELSKMDIDSEEAEYVMEYMLILAAGDMQGKLDKDTKKKYDKFMEKVQDSDEFKNYKANEKAIIETLKNADIDWDQAFEEETSVPEDSDVVVEEDFEVAEW